MKLAAGYLRRSAATAENPGNASREAQEEAVRSLCGDDVLIYADWGVSGSGRSTEKRVEYKRLKADIAAGKVGSVCAYSLSRLGRNTRELLEFIDLCREHGVTVRTKVETIDTASAMGRAIVSIMAVFSELELEVGAERSAAARQAMKDRGDDLRRPGYGYRRERNAEGVLVRVPNPEQPIEPIVDAYEQAGSVLGAAKLLQAQNVPAPRGGKRWSTSLVTRILAEQGVIPRPDWMLTDADKVGRQPAQRRPKRPSVALAGLLRCPFCGRTMTPNAARGQMYCANGARDRAGHPRYAVREVDVLPWVQSEAERFDPGDDIEEEQLEKERTELVESRRKLGLAFSRGALDDATYEAEDGALAARLTTLDERGALRPIPHAGVDWEAGVPQVNDFLRSIIEYVELDPQLRPTRAEWRVPEYRAAG